MTITPELVLAGLAIVIVLFALWLLHLARLDSIRFDRAREAAAVRLAKARSELGLSRADRFGRG